MEFLQYDIRVAVLIAVFYMFYRLLLSRDSLHQLNRLVLLGTAVASFALPLCVVTIHRTEWISSTPEMPVTASVAATPAAVVAVPWWQTVLPAVFWAGVAITLLYTVVSISKICILISRCEKHRQGDGTVIAVAPGEVSPFSWMHYIVVSRSDYAHPDRAILLHEREHVRRHHSVDVVAYGGNGSSDADAEARKKGEADGRTALEAEAVRVVSSMPAWQPGKQDGKPVKVHYTIPLTFRLQ